MKPTSHELDQWHLWTRRPILSTVLIASALCQLGCADWMYARVGLGQVLHEYSRVFPEEQTRRTPASLCYFSQEPGGRTDTIVLLLARDRRVAAKLQATYVERRWGLKTDTTYALRGEIDPTLAAVEATGPADALRVVADELTLVEGDQSTKDAHGWVAAGLVRLLQRWPHIGDEGPAPLRLTDILERVPSEGVARISIDQRRSYLIEYTSGNVR